MEIKHRYLWVLAALYGLGAVALLAIASHAVEEPADAARVQLVGTLWLAHVPALLIAALHCTRTPWPAYCMWAGLLLFGVGVLGHALAGILWPVPVAPAGGLLLMGSWLWFAVMGAMRPRT